MDLMAQIQEALDAGDFEKAEQLLAEVEAGGDEAMKATASAVGKMMRSAKACGAPKAAPPPAPPPKPAPVVAGLAVSRDSLAVTRAVELAEGAAKRSDRATVRMLISCSRACFDAADEREHLELADPDATERHIKSVERKLKTGTIAAAREAVERKEPAEAKKVDETHGLDATEIGIAAVNHVSLADFAAAKARVPAGRKAG